MAVRQDKVQVNVEINGAKAGESLKEIRGNVKQLNRELELLVPGTEAFNRKAAELARVKKPLDDVRDALRGINNELKNSSESGGIFQNVLSTALGIFTGGALLQGVQSVFSGIKGFLTESSAAFNEADTASKQLTQALNGNVEASDRLQGQAGDLQKSLKGLFGDDDIVQAQTRLGLYTKEASAIEELTPKILDLAAAKGVDLVTAAEAVGRSVSGNGDALKKLGISVKDAGTEQERLRVISDGLTAAVGGQAEVVANSGTSGWQRFKNVFGEVQETIGGKLAPIISKLGDFLANLLEKTTPVIDVFKGVFSVFGDVWTQVKQLLASFGLLNDKTSIADVIIKALTTTAKLLGTALQAVGVFVRGVISTFNELVAVGSGSVNVLVSLFSGFKDFIANVFGNIGAILKGALTLDFDAVKAGVAGLRNVYADLGTQVRTAYEIGYKTVKDRQKAVADQEDEAETVKLIAKAGARGKAVGAKESEESTKERQKALAKAAEISKQLQELADTTEDARLNAMRDGIDKELAQENVRYGRLQEAFTQKINALRLNGVSEARIREQNDAFRLSAESEHYLKLADISKKFQDKKLADEKKSSEDIRKQREQDFQFELAEINAYYDAVLAAIRGKAAAEAAAANGGSPDALAGIEKRSADAAIAVELAKNQELLRLNQDYGKSTIENENFIADQRIQAAERTATVRKQSEEIVKQTIGDALSFGIEALSRDEAARKKNAGLIKAFTIAKVTINLQQELSEIFKNANASPANILVPGSGNIIGAIQAALAVGRAGLAFSKIGQQEFSGGGPTGAGIGVPDRTGHRVAGIVHANEWVSPKWMTQHPVYGHVIHQLEDARMRGFANGGFTTTPTTGVPQLGAVLNEGLLNRIANAVERFPNELKARVVYTEFEGIQDDVNDVRDQASIG